MIIWFDFFQHENMYLVQINFFMFFLGAVLKDRLEYSSMYNISDLIDFIPFLLIISAISLSFELLWWKAFIYIVLTLLINSIIIHIILEITTSGIIVPSKKLYIFYKIRNVTYLIMSILLLITIYTIGTKIFN